MDAYSILLSVVMSTLPGPHDYTVQVMDRLWSCGSWCLASMPTLGGGGLYAGASGFLPKLKVETNERDGKSQWITVRVCEASSNLPDLPTRADGGGNCTSVLH